MTELLLPDLDDDEARPFWEACAAGQLRVQRCSACGLVRHPPRPMCPRCRATQRDWIAVRGSGTIWSFVIAHPPLLPAYAALAPYNVIVVELDDHPGIRLVGNLVPRSGSPINSIEPHSITIGEAVTVVFDPVDDVTLPRWVRASG